MLRYRAHNYSLSEARSYLSQETPDVPMKDTVVVVVASTQS